MANKKDELPHKFGEDIRQEFMLRPGTVFLNHASYGAMPKCVHEKQISYLCELESHPDMWFRFNMYKYLDESRKHAAEFVGANSEDIFLMQNATKAINTVLKAFPMTSHDAILITNLTYYAVKMTANVTAERVNGRVHELEIIFPIQNSYDIIQKYEECLSQHPDIKIVVIDHITSPSTILLPIKELTAMCHKYGVIVIIDGAQAPGQIDLDLQGYDADFYTDHITSPSTILLPIEELTAVCHKYGVIVIIDGAQAPGQIRLDLQGYDADFYTGNFHKWMYCPRGCAFLWRNPKRKHDWLRPLVTSAFEKVGLTKAFSYEGTKDDTPYICTADGIEFYRRIGGHLEDKWNTRRLTLPDDMVPPNIQVVELPFIPGFSDKPERSLELQHLISHKFNVQTFTVNLQNKLYIRLSIQVYNTMDDVVKLGDAILKLTNNVD